MNDVLRRLARDVRDADLPDLPRVRALRSQLSDLQQRRAKAVQEVKRVDHRLAEIKAAVDEREKELAALESSRASRAAKALLGDEAAQEQFEADERLMESHRRYVEQFRIAGPEFERRRKAAQRPVASLADQESRIEELIRDELSSARIEVARSRL